MIDEQCIDLPALYRWQAEVFADPHRFRVVAASRRSGKNHLGAVELLRVFLAGGNTWFITVDHPTGKPMWRLLLKLVSRIPGVVVNKADRIITAPTLTDGYIQVRSANSGLRGEGLSLVVFDEVIDIPNFVEIWQGDILPTLATTRGRALFISSVFTFDDFWDLVVYARDSGDPAWRAWVLNAYEAGVIPREEIEAQRSAQSPARFAREYMCEPMTLGAVFKLDSENKSARRQDAAIPGHNYVFGVDIGGSVDNTSIAVVDTTLTPPELVHLDTFLNPSFTAQIARLKDLADRFNPSAIIVETNNAGQAFLQQAETAGVTKLRPLTTNNASKANQVEGLVMAFEQHKFAVIDDPALILELAAFESSKTPSGLVSYAAAKGHDDRVMSLLLSWAAISAPDNKVHFHRNPFYQGEIIPTLRRVARPITISSEQITAAAIADAYKWEPDDVQKRIAVDIEDGDHLLMSNLLINRKSTPVVCCPRCYAWTAQLFIDQRRQLVCRTCLEELEPKVDVNQPNKQKEGITQ